MKKLWQFALIIVFLSSCSTPSYVDLYITHLPKFTFKNSPAKVLVINLYDASQTGIKNTKKLNVLRNAAYASLNCVVDRLKQFSQVEIINLTEPNNITADSIPMLLNKHHAQYILALNYLTANFELDKIDDYGKDKLKNAQYNINTAVDYTFFNNEGGVISKLSGSSSHHEADMLVTNTFAAVAFGPSIKNNSIAVDNSAIDATGNMLQYFSQYTSIIQRPLYKNDELENAVLAIQARYFERADSILKPMINDKNTRLASKAAYNLSVVYEAMGNTAAARDMATLSLNRNDNWYARAELNALDVTN
ncbi:hypothetical protein BDD43_0342 [Mucilaginibacter gracilis]|uniref:Tetratricopeptide repeat protein n=1 Tax=Mucilaginibacter gracilis TaxID=423350 RepID=A0A495IU13_9SPHI|nr:DUF6340 family protein [Mucilaginibacter gracilis]RKR80246.1 hypothetical protein BDD43_0342 [Mucilaginibacter gracilis]